jgi:hypothetical protein
MGSSRLLILCGTLFLLGGCKPGLKAGQACTSDEDCQAGLVCQPTGVFCVTSPCPSAVCSQPGSDDAGVSDAGQPEDSGTPATDAGPRDGGEVDAGQGDAGLPDADCEQIESEFYTATAQNTSCVTDCDCTVVAYPPCYCGGVTNGTGAEAGAAALSEWYAAGCMPVCTADCVGPPNGAHCAAGTCVGGRPDGGMPDAAPCL